MDSQQQGTVPATQFSTDLPEATSSGQKWNQRLNREGVLQSAFATLTHFELTWSCAKDCLTGGTFPTIFTKVKARLEVESKPSETQSLTGPPTYNRNKL